MQLPPILQGESLTRLLQGAFVGFLATVVIGFGWGATVNMVELKKVSSWMQDSYIEKGGWATFPGMSSPDRGVAQACATLLTTVQ